MNQPVKNTFIHLRFPFSFFLMPVFLFALSQNPDADFIQTIALFLILHLLVYPSSNGYNSFMDNDTESIGSIKNPPKVPKAMFTVTLLMDCMALALAYILLGAIISLLILTYILASRAYSYRGIRIKKYPVWGYFHVGFFQGIVIFLICTLTFNNQFDWDTSFFLSLMLSFLLVGAGYPLTQVYQHKQDKADGVKTISMLLGINGTFTFCTVMFALLGILAGIHFVVFQHSVSDALLFYLFLLPVFLFFNNWKQKVFKDPSQANFENAMRMNKIGASAINFFFIFIILKNLYYP